jgi:hypothetical protein
MIRNRENAAHAGSRQAGDPTAIATATDTFDRDDDGSIKPAEFCRFKGEGAIGQVLEGFVKDVCDTMRFSATVENTSGH